MRGVSVFICVHLWLLFCVTGCDPGAEQPGAPPKPDAAPEAKAGALAEEVDLTADKPGAAAKRKEAPLLAVLGPAGPSNDTVRHCYKLLAEMKTNAERISADLDAGGKEITRLIRTSDALSRNITDLAGVWPHDESFRDVCGNAKRLVLVLNEELSRVPRKWTHVRWSFSAALQEVSRLRLRARDLAEAEPKPVPVIGKDGKPVLDKEGRPIYVDPPAPPVDPAIAKREQSLREVQAERERIRRIEEAKKTKPLRTELDDN